MKCIGGPLDGQDLDSPASVIQIAGFDDMEYVRTRPTDTDWRERIDWNWWIRGLPEPVAPDHVYEWHPRGWVSPEVRMIRNAVEEASAKFG